MSAPEFTRRNLLKSATLGAAGATLNLGALQRALAAGDLTVGIVYVGARDDFGWNQAHAVAIKSLKDVPGVKVVEEENVPETDAVSKSMESMINLDGAGLILATSFGYYTPFVVDLAKNGSGYVDARKKILRQPTYTSATIGISALMIPGLLLEVQCTAAVR